MVSPGLLQQVDYEIIPLKGVVERISFLDPGSVITVTASPAKGIDPTIDLAIKVEEMGYRAVAHLAARFIENRAKLESVVDLLRGGGVERLFVIGGDGDPVGEYEDALSLLVALGEIGHQFREVGIAGYPEGHPAIPDSRLRSAMLEKAPYATYLATQMCFSAKRIIGWLESVRSDGVELPVKVGVPGVVDPIRLISVGSRIGVGQSLRYVSKNRSILRMIRPGPYKPKKLVKAIEGGTADLGVTGLHLFTFNQVEPTAEWVRKARG